MLFPSPTSGTLFILFLKESEMRKFQGVSVPNFGDSFYIWRAVKGGIKKNEGFPSPTSGTLFIFNSRTPRGVRLWFPSPTSGTLFIWREGGYTEC